MQKKLNFNLIFIMCFKKCLHSREEKKKLKTNYVHQSECITSVIKTSYFIGRLMRFLVIFAHTLSVCRNILRWKCRRRFISFFFLLSIFCYMLSWLQLSLLLQLRPCTHPQHHSSTMQNPNDSLFPLIFDLILFYVIF